MNYYIQGSPARSEEIKAAFEKLGYNTRVNGWNFNSDRGVYFTNEADKSVDYTSIETFANLIKTHPDYKELVLSVKPMFKVGDWVVGDDGIFNITQYEDEYGYELTDTTGRVVHFLSPDYVESNFHLWRIEDAKDGDVLVCYSEAKGNPIEQAGIFKKYVGQHGGCSNTFFAHTGIDWDGNIIINGYMGSTNILPATKKQCDLFFSKMREVGYTWDVGKKELRRIIEPMFKVGDWITDGISKCQIYFIDNTQYWYSENCILGSIESVNKRYHLWSIADAKDGDVLCIYECDEPKIVFILKGTPKKHYALSYHCYYNIMYPNFVSDSEEGCLAPNDEDVKPVTKEQRDLFFTKMREAGYQWDADKKELKKIKPHYDISNFHAGMPVLVRDNNVREWRYTEFSHISSRFHEYKFAAGCTYWTECIPFEGNEHLLGTTDMPSEEFINW